MKVLFFCPGPIYPLLGGFELRVYHICRELSRHHELTLFCKSHGEVDQETMTKLNEIFSSVRMFPVEKLEGRRGRSRSVVKLLGDLIDPPVDYRETSTHSRELFDALAEARRSSQIEIFHVLGLNMLRYLPDLEDLPAVCDAIDDYSLFCLRTIRHQKSLRQKIGFFNEWIATRRFERKHVERFKETVLVSSIDARVMQSICPEARISVIPNGVDAEYFRPSDVQLSTPSLMFSGVMDYEPNVTAAMFLIKRILPLIRREIPEVKLTVVGRDPSPELVELARSQEGVTLTGFVDDIRPYFERSMIYVAPLLSGVGIKNKVFEAWAMAKPVVATSMSTDGIDVADLEDIMIADKPTEFAHAVTELIRNPELRRRLGQSAREKVILHYSWESQADKFTRIYERVRAEWPRGHVLGRHPKPANDRHLKTGQR